MRAILCVVALSMTACGGGGNSTDTATPALSPEMMKAAILIEKRTAFKDPESIRDARIGQPWSCLIWTACLCFEINARNSFGGYTGVRPHVGMFSGTKLVSIREGSFTDQCDNMTPFPEMNGGYVPQAPAPTPQTRKK